MLGTTPRQLAIRIPLVDVVLLLDDLLQLFVAPKVLEFLRERSSPLKPAVHGFVSKRSILTNALVHCSPKTKHVFNIDLEDFFPSIAAEPSDNLRCGLLRYSDWHFSRLRRGA